MAARPVWKGYLKLSLVSIPVKAYTVRKTDHGEIHFNQLHEKCHSRIRYKKTCPLHGEVPNDEIISGYEVAKDQYVPIDPDELKAIRRKNDQSIEIDTLIAEPQLDDRYLTEQSYYLVPDGKVAQKPYTLVRGAMEDDSLRAVATVILSNREQLVMVRPLGKLLLMTILQHDAALKSPGTFEEDVQEPDVSNQEQQLTKQLVQGFVSKAFDYEQYKDEYQERLSELVAAKIEGKELVSTPQEDAPAVINLMDALKASLKQIPVPKASVSKGGKSEKASSKPATVSRARKTKPKRIAAPSSSRSGTKKRGSRKSG